MPELIKKFDKNGEFTGFFVPPEYVKDRLLSIMPSFRGMAQSTPVTTQNGLLGIAGRATEAGIVGLGRTNGKQFAKKEEK